MTRVAVIGAGMGGLAAAIRLASAGMSVVVYEAGPRPGGKAGIAEVDGVEFDTGPSVFTLRQTLEGVAEDAGVGVDEICTLIRPDPAFRYRWPDGVVLDVFQDPERTRDEVKRVLGEPAAREWAHFMNYAKGIWEAAAPYFVMARAPTVRSVAALGVGGLAAVTRIDAFRSMAAAARALVKEPHLRDLVLRFATYNGSDPRVAPATLHCIAHVEMGLGSFGVQGGMHELPRGLERLALARGVLFEYRSPVSRIVVQGGRATGIEVKGRVESADAVVVNADVSHLVHDLLPPEVRHGLADSPSRSTSGWTAVLRVTGGDEVAHTAFFPEVYLREFEDMFDHDRPPQTPTVYMCDQRAAHGRSGWSDGSRPVFVMANAPAEPAAGARPPEVWRTLRDRVLARLQGVFTGCDVVWERTPADLAASFPGSRGALYGAASNSMFSAFQRPPNVLARVPGLYLASGSAHPGGGVPLCLQSGRLAAEGLLQDFRRVG